jgi:hypothetical protein
MVKTDDGGEFLPNMENGGRWHHIASERELSTVMHRDKEMEVYEVPAMCVTFLISKRFLVIIRAEALGGDTRNIEGGWVYDNSLRFAMDREEILSLWNAFGGYGRNSGGVTKESAAT